ncbi:MAG: hypothetical protein HKN71_04000 [Gemmatimonadetes bacterium]|nr:hypothetical protein [Gemmatimonadota bacterium]
MSHDIALATHRKSDRIARYRTDGAALALLRHKRSEVVVDLAHWMNNHQARLEVTQLQQEVADMDRDRRRIVIVAVTGVGSLIGAFAFTQVASRIAGASFTSWSMAAPVVTRVGASLTTSAPLRITMRQIAIGQIARGTLISVPVSVALERYVGSSALRELWQLAASLRPAASLKPWTATRVPGASTEDLPEPLRDAVAQRVSLHLAEASVLVQALSLMSRPQRQEWYRTLRADVSAMVDREHGDLPAHQRAALYATLLWDFLNGLRNEFDALDQRWTTDLRTLANGIQREQFGITRVAARESGRLMRLAR